MDDRIERLRTAFEREIERKAVALVEDEFERLRRIPPWKGPIDVPFIGGLYLPSAPRERHGELKKLVTRAVVAERRFSCEPMLGPSHPLPLRLDDCQDLSSCGDYWLGLIGRYGLWSRKIEWDYRGVEFPFAKFCKRDLNPIQLTVHQGGKSDENQQQP